MHIFYKLCLLYFMLLCSRSSGPSSDVYDLRDEVDVIYEDLCSQSRKSSIQVNWFYLSILVPLTFVLFLGLPMFHLLMLNSSLQGSAPVTKRDYCIKELIETEKNYLEALRMIIDVFPLLLFDLIIFNWVSCFDYFLISKSFQVWSVWIKLNLIKNLFKYMFACE